MRCTDRVNDIKNTTAPPLNPPAPDRPDIFREAENSRAWQTRARFNLTIIWENSGRRRGPLFPPGLLIPRIRSPPPLNMKCYSFSSVVVVALLVVSFCDGQSGGGRRKIPIGILIHNGTQFADIALKTAVHRFISFNRFDVVTYTEDISNLDSFQAGQIVCDMASRGILAIFGPDSGETNEIVQSVAENLELPQFQTFWNSKMVSTKSFNLYPEPKLLAKALATLLKEMHWKSYTILYEDVDGIIRLQEVLKLRDADGPQVTIKKLLPGRDQRSVLKEIKAAAEFNIILECRTERILDILQQATQVKLMEEYHSYILTSLDSHTLDFDSLRPIRCNITSLRFLDVQGKNVKDVVFDWEFNEALRGNRIKISPEKIPVATALLHDSLNLFLTFYAVLHHTTGNMGAKPLSCSERGTSDHGLGMAEFIKVRNFTNGQLPGPLTGNIQFDRFGRRTHFNLQTIEFTTEGFIETGRWSSLAPDRINFTLTHQEREKQISEQIQKTVFRVASRLGAPYLMLRNSTKALVGNDRFEGYALDVIQGIAEQYNFTYRFEIVPDNRYGSYNHETKEWDGLIRQLLDMSADLAICDLTITYERGRVVDFTMPFMTIGISILYSKPVKDPPELLSFMHPLSLDIWLFMATAYLIMSILIYVTARLAPGDWENPHPCNPEPEELENIWTLKNCLWLTLGSIMAQGSDILPKGISTRMIASMWWFFSLALTASYTANLAAFLTMERMEPTIESAEDLARQTDIKYGCVLGGATSTFFRDSNFSTYQRMWRQMQQSEPSVFEKDNKEGVKRVKGSKRKYAFLMESSSIEYEMERDCELMQVGSWLDSKGYGIALPVNSPYRTKFSQAILRMQEDGKLQKLKDKWWRQKYGGGKCNETKHSSEESASELGIDHVGGIFVVLAGGLAIAFLIGISEFLWNVRKVSVEGQMSPKDAFIKEIKFAVNVSVLQKYVLRRTPDCCS